MDSSLAVNAGRRALDALYTLQSAYGSSGNSDGTIPGYTALTFDLLLERIVE